MTLSRGLWLGAVGLALVVSVVAASTSCSQTPTNVAVRTFQTAQKMDIVCMQVNDQYGNPLPGGEIKPVKPDNCQNVATNGNTFTPAYHLYAVVTQLVSGQLAVVDLTNGAVIDEDRATPGINFITTGPLPSDVAVSPDGAMTFVSSAFVTNPGIYGIDNRRLLGDSTGAPSLPPLALTDLPACSLPQPPEALTIESTGDGYVLLAMLRGKGQEPHLYAIDPTPLLRGVNLADAGPTDSPGKLAPCTVLGSVGFQGAGSMPATWSPGATYPDGVPYVDGGVQLVDAEPPVAPPGLCAASGSDGGAPAVPFQVGPLTESYPSAMALRTDTSTPYLYVADAELPMIHVFDVSTPTSPVEKAPLLATSVLNPTQRIGVSGLAISPPTRDYKVYLYAIDSTNGSLMVYDITTPSSVPVAPMIRPHAELNPFVPPDRISFSGSVAAVTFVQHDWLLPSQADDNHYYSGILCNPNRHAHPESNIFVDKGAYYRPDQAGLIQNSGTVENFPSRLRGVFGFVTLTNGLIVPIDVDDWDAPCRRPDPMASLDGGAADEAGPWVAQSGLLDVPEPNPTSPTDVDPYHAPVVYQTNISESAGVTLEAFFPVSAPHRPRSNWLLLNDPNSGEHIPYLVNTPQLFDVNGSPVQVGPGVSGAPLILPTAIPPNYFDPSQQQNPDEPNVAGRTANNSVLAFGADEVDGGGQAANGGAMAVAAPGVRMSFDDPTAHVDQGWTLTYEGVLPGTPSISADLDTTDGYQTLVLTSGVETPDGGGPANGLGTPGFCATGIEDWTIGQARAQAVASAGAPPRGNWTTDYVELADDILAQGDPYWSVTGNACWEDTQAGLEDGAKDVADNRFNACSQEFGQYAQDAGTSGEGTLADTYYSRDFPILHAYDDHLVLGRWGYTGTETTQNRVVVGPDPSNVKFLKIAQCCFHHQSTFKVRTGGEWVLVGQNGIGLLHHVQADSTGACTLACNPDYVLANSRLVDLSVPQAGTSVNCPTLSSLPLIGRDDPRALRNPMFSFIMYPGCGVAQVPGQNVLTARDLQWRFSELGGFSPIGISLTQGSSVAVAPQSMRFVEPLGQLAVVDGAQQGLTLFDLNVLAPAHSPYF